jgi:hypothetical protein
VILGFQVLTNAIQGGAVLHDAGSGAGAEYALGYFGIAVAAVLLACLVFTVAPRRWVRPVIIVMEVLSIPADLVGLVFHLALAVVVIGIMLNGDVRSWYQSS